MIFEAPQYRFVCIPCDSMSCLLRSTFGSGCRAHVVVDAFVMAASKSSCKPKVDKRPAQKVARRPKRAKAGLTAKSNPSSQAPRARNSFQLFFSDAIRQGTVRNIREAAPKWHGMSEEEKAMGHRGIAGEA